MFLSWLLFLSFMGLYGLDFIFDSKKGKYQLLEIGGVNSGMGGFVDIYGDNRVEFSVIEHFRQKHDYKICSMYLSDYRTIMNKKNPVRSRVASLMFDSKFNLRFLLKPSILSSDKAYADWIKEETKMYACSDDLDSINNLKPRANLRPYREDHVVFNFFNFKIDNECINSWAEEEVASNKCLTYMLLKDSEISDLMLDSTFVGLGATNQNELSHMKARHNKLIIKPILGVQGNGFRLLKSGEVNNYLKDDNKLRTSSFKNNLIRMLLDQNAPTLEDYILQNDYSFEGGVAIVQPFINSGRKKKGKVIYSSIRAIVCDGKFVDAYSRESHKTKVNYSKGAKAKRINDLKGLDKLSEKVVRVFKSEVEKYDPESVKQDLYLKYFGGLSSRVSFKDSSDLVSLLSSIDFKP